MLLDAAELIVADTDEIMLDMSGLASVQMNDAPNSPVTTSTVLISLFQHNMVGWRVVRPLNFLMRRANAVATLVGIAL